MPSAAAEGATGLTLGGSKYSEFEIEPGGAILSLVYGPVNDSRIEADGGGSAGVGEPGRSVKSVATPEWVRIPPPPLSASGRRQRSSPPKFRRTRLSTGHQVTIPREPYREARLQVGDKFEVTADGPGRVILERID